MSTVAEEEEEKTPVLADEADDEHRRHQLRVAP